MDNAERYEGWRKIKADQHDNTAGKVYAWKVLKKAKNFDNKNFREDWWLLPHILWKFSTFHTFGTFCGNAE